MASNVTDWDSGATPQASTPQNATLGIDGSNGPFQPGNPSPPALREQAADIGRKAGSGARQLATQAQSTAERRLEKGKREAASTLTSVASTLLHSGTQLRDGEQPIAGEYLQRTARQIERVAHYVENRQVRQMVNEVENFARQKPAIFIGSAFAIGVLAARFLKNSRVADQRAAEPDKGNGYSDREVSLPASMETGSRGNGQDFSMDVL
jgi:hypothetical protein